MKKQVTVWLLTAATCLAVSSCQKESSASSGDSLMGETPRRTALTSNAWEFREQTLVYGPGEVDNFQGEPCKTDEQFFFTPNGDATVNHGDMACTPGQPEINGTYAQWRLLQNGQTLQLVYTRDMPGGFTAGQTIDWTVDYISANKLVIKRTETEPGKTYTVIDTYYKD
jgi:hypothetical protein